MVHGDMFYAKRALTNCASTHPQQLWVKYWHERRFQKLCFQKTYVAIVFIGQLSFFLLLPSLLFYQKERCYGSEILNAWTSYQKKVMYGKSQSPDSPFISHYAIIQGEMGLFLTISVFELQRGYLYKNGVEFRQKVIGAG